MHRLKPIFIIIILVLMVSLGFYFKDFLGAVYGNASEAIQNFQKTNLGKLVEEFKKEILAPSPLHIGGRSNNVVLTASQVVIETNMQRQANGNLPALTLNAKLVAAAKAKADDMFANQYFEHVSPSGVDPGELVKAHGYDYIVTGENLILGNFKDEADVVQHWMDSPGHRANILNNRFAEIGVAMVKGTYNGETVWIGVQEFGLPMSTCSEPSTTLKNQIDSNKQTLDALALQIEAKKAEINRTSRQSDKYSQLVDEYNALVHQYNTLNYQTRILIDQYNGQANTFNKCVAGTT